MKNKNSLSEAQQAELKAERLDSEKKLLPRLKFMGYVMQILAVASVTFAIVAPEESELETQLEMERFSAKNKAAGLSLENDDDLLELTPAEVLNYYLIGAIFAVVGSSCFFICWKKKKHLWR